VVLCLSPLGDTIFATSAIRALRENFSQARIVILASPIAAQVLKYNPYQLEVLTAIERWDLLKMLTQIRKENFDIAISLSQLGGFFTRFCAAPVWSDFTLIPIQAGRSVVQMCHDVLGVIGIDNQTRQRGTEFWYSEREQQVVEIFLRASAYRENEKPLIAVHIGGHYFARKRWPIANFIEIIRFFTEELGLQVVLVGGQEDVEDSLVIKSVFPGIISAVGMLKLAETAALLKHCHLFIGNDSGPLHLAAAINIPTIGLFGPTAPGQFYPYPSPQHAYIYKNLSCSPCYRFGGGIWQYLPRCTKAHCMESITTREVVSMAGRMLPLAGKQQMGCLYAGRS
jgi:ADP-heptose:LPS heptosyltransferase